MCTSWSTFTLLSESREISRGVRKLVGFYPVVNYVNFIAPWDEISRVVCKLVGFYLIVNSVNFRAPWN